MTTIKELAKRSNDFINSLEIQIEQTIEEADQQLADISRGQLMSSMGSDGNPLKNNKTGLTTLSPAYARKTGKKRPNIFLKGEYQSEMFTSSNGKSYFQSSNDRKNKFLQNNFDNLHGIAKQNQNQAKSITTTILARRYKKALQG